VSRSKTVFVLSGGASLGASQVGMLQALAERDIQPDLLIGTSAGALNTAFIAGHPFTPQSVEALAKIWRGLSSLAIFPPDPLFLLKSLGGQTGSLCSNHGLRNLISKNLTFKNLEDAETPCKVVATNFLTGQEVTLDTGDACDAVLASAAIPGIFPPIIRDEMTLMDGGLANNTALSEAVAADADTIYILPSGYSCALKQAPRTPLGAAVQAMTILIHQRLVMDINRYAAEVNLIVLPPPCPVRVSPANFSKGGELIDAAYLTASRALDRTTQPSDPAASIDFHTH
jgi:NTE family protein